MSVRVLRVGLLVATAITLVAACSGKPEAPEEADLFAELVAAETGLEEGAAPPSTTTNVGPVSASVRFHPENPQLGDLLYVLLEVSAPPKVDIEMPEFGDGLGRFSIVDYDWRVGSSDGKSVHKQIYQLQAAASGPLRVPQLRVEFVDRRPATPGGDTDPRGEPRELLTDELRIIVSPIELGDDEQALRTHAGRLSVDKIQPWHHWWVWALVIGFLVVAALVLFFSTRGRKRSVFRINAYDKARHDLELLQSAGLPEIDELDAWYVELSSIVRSYLEHRFSVRAPELTTEEFLREARRAPELTTEHQDTLAAFLAGCDRVKFAGHQPSTEEQTSAIGSALKFVTDTRPADVIAVDVETLAEVTP